MNRNDREYLVQKIRAQYIGEEHTELDVLRELDKKVKAPANTFSIVLGSVAAIIMGSGMSLVMTNIGESIGIMSPVVPGIIIGVAGMLLAIVNYPIYKKILSGRRRKYAGQIIEITDKILKD